MERQSTSLTIGRAVIEEEAAALHALSAGLGDGFEQAVDLIAQATGRAIISGMGKSGHIARKIAATLASTGTPAHFVHPAEASHGDLGMLTGGDVVMVLSNSGETPELADLVAYTRSRNIPLIGVASKAGSTLLSKADVAIVLPNLGEACGTGIVPSTSTTMTLALGDALAITLMKNRSFTPENFRDFHPGGKLGARLSKVSDLMHTGDAVPIVAANSPMAEVLLEITRKGFGVAGVVDGHGHLIGIITDGDLRRHMDDLMDQTAGDVMTADPLTISPDVLAEDALAQMTERKITCFLTHPGRGPSAPMGILHIHDCLRAGLTA